MSDLMSMVQAALGGGGASIVAEPWAAHACNCMGPQNGEPVCPCMMRGVKIVNGRYVKTTDLGPASTPTTDDRGEAI